MGEDRTRVSLSSVFPFPLLSVMSCQKYALVRQSTTRTSHQFRRPFSAVPLWGTPSFCQARFSVAKRDTPLICKLRIYSRNVRRHTFLWSHLPRTIGGPNRGWPFCFLKFAKDNSTSPIRFSRLCSNRTAETCAFPIRLLEDWEEASSTWKDSHHNDLHYFIISYFIIYLLFPPYFLFHYLILVLLCVLSLISSIFSSPFRRRDLLSNHREAYHCSWCFI